VEPTCSFNDVFSAFVQPVLRADGDFARRSPMNRLPEQSNLNHLKKQAKDLIRSYRNGDPHAILQFRQSLPAAAGRSDEEIVALKLRLHDAQWCLARAYGFTSWTDLRVYVEARAGARDNRVARSLRWLRLVYAGEVSGGGFNRANPRVAVRMLLEGPNLAAGDPYLGCAIGDEGALQMATAADPTWVNRPGGPLRLTPLAAVTHSSLLQLPDFRECLRGSARYLLSVGADPNQRFGYRLPAATLSTPDNDHLLSPLYGASGVNRDSELTRLLLEAGADPNDGESLYHSVENVDCTRLLLEYGARVDENNALYRALDFDNVGVSNFCSHTAPTPMCRQAVRRSAIGERHYCGRYIDDGRAGTSRHCSRQARPRARRPQAASALIAWRCSSGSAMSRRCFATAELPQHSRMMSSLLPHVPVATRPRRDAFTRGDLICRARCPTRGCGCYPTWSPRAAIKEQDLWSNWVGRSRCAAAIGTPLRSISRCS
jgi:hypothetical protein